LVKKVFFFFFMPELPEVECTRLSLQQIEGLTLKEIILSPLAPLKKVQGNTMRSTFQGLKLEKLKRRSKYLIFVFEKDISLIIHLGMSGRLRYYSKKAEALKHTHLKLIFNNGSQVHYTDARRFGSLSLSFQKNFSDNPLLDNLGLDYNDPNLTFKTYLKACRRHPKLNLKSLLLNQKIAAGLGNIYACESLYQAHLDPRKLVEETKDEELKKLLQAAKKVLKLGIQQGGVSLRDYLNGLGHRGVMQNYLQVYGREGKTTLDGQGQVSKIVQNQRGTWFCPKIQL
ncbi:MAG: bifunctional DNA-formamidopyrimidine glycosylase/DNA-(apurinic or apyrimidinic site) lyase, partial [Deltaproteobacteria bacterium]|nr:bifunctional DNA-formamidopyrimidine glycosylase/DNA-(apurinic or apyrimidinic site) lyase [Deltaproteobacteria bacterium]